MVFYRLRKWQTQLTVPTGNYGERGLDWIGYTGCEAEIKK